MRETINYFFGEGSKVSQVWNVRRNIPESVNKGLFSIQKSTIFLVFGMCVFLSIIEFTLSFQLHKYSTRISLIYSFSIFLIASSMVIMLFYIGTKINNASNESEKIRQNTAIK